MENSRWLDLSINTCHCHDHPVTCIGTIITQSDNVKENKRGDARLYEVHICGCGHTGINITASKDVIANKRGSTRRFDNVVGCLIGINITGSENIKINDASGG